MRRDLGYSPEEVDEMPWWQQRMFIEEINRQHEDPEDDNSDADVTSDLEALGFSTETIA